MGLSDKSSRIQKAFSVVAFGTLVSSVIGFIFHPVIARMLGTQSYGVLAVILSLISILSHFFLFGVREAMRKFLPMYSGRKNTVASFGAGILIFLGFIPLITGVLLRNNLFQGFTSLNTIYLSFALLVVAVMNIFKGLRSILYGLFREGEAEALRIFQRLLYLLLSVSLVSIGLGVEGVLLASVFSLALGAVFAYYLVSKSLDLGFKHFLEADDTLRKEFLGFSSVVLITVLFNQVHLNIDVLLVGLLRGGESAGIYKVAIVAANFLFMVPSISHNASLHNFSEVAGGGSGSLEAYVGPVIKYVSMVMALLVTGIFVLSEEFVLLFFGEEYMSAVLPLRLLLSGAFFAGLSKAISPALEAKGKLKHVLIPSAVSMTVNVFLNIVFIIQFGVIGAALATTFSYILMFVFYLYYLHKDVEDIEFGFVYSVMVSTLFTGAILLVLDFLVESLVFSFVIVPPTGLLVYTFLVVRSGGLGSDEVQAMKSLIDF